MVLTTGARLKANFLFMVGGTANQLLPARDVLRVAPDHDVRAEAEADAEGRGRV
jgi:hypothetical protein